MSTCISYKGWYEIRKSTSSSYFQDLLVHMPLASWEDVVLHRTGNTLGYQLSQCESGVNKNQKAGINPCDCVETHKSASVASLVDIIWSRKDLTTQSESINMKPEQSYSGAQSIVFYLISIWNNNKKKVIQRLGVADVSFLPCRTSWLRMIPETPLSVHHRFVTSGPNAIPTPWG
jgi:hypothetical protein